MSHTPPATQLWLGSSSHLNNQLVDYLKKILCPQRGCQNCIICKQIKNQQHHAIRWLSPEKQQYTVAQLEAVFKELAFALTAGELFFFIFEQADLLSITCANSLLKYFEEPPAGYHFILLAGRADMILPTIKSRCVIQQFDASFVNEKTFLDFLKSKTATLQQFNKEFEKAKITEYETRTLLDQLLIFWVVQEKAALYAQDTLRAQRALRNVRAVMQSFEQLPMPGSVKIFWRNLFLFLHY